MSSDYLAHHLFPHFIYTSFSLQSFCVTSVTLWAGEWCLKLITLPLLHSRQWSFIIRINNNVWQWSAVLQIYESFAFLAHAVQSLLLYETTISAALRAENFNECCAHFLLIIGKYCKISPGTGSEKSINLKQNERLLGEQMAPSHYYVICLDSSIYTKTD